MINEFRNQSRERRTGKIQEQSIGYISTKSVNIKTINFQISDINAHKNAEMCVINFIQNYKLWKLKRLSEKIWKIFRNQISFWASIFGVLGLGEGCDIRFFQHCFFFFVLCFDEILGFMFYLNVSCSFIFLPTLSNWQFTVNWFGS